jgi:hypothetical protein
MSRDISGVRGGSVGGGGRRGGSVGPRGDLSQDISGVRGGSQSGRGGGTFVGGSGLTRDTMQQQDQTGANVAAAQRDFRNEGNSFGDDLGNMIAGFMGLNEQDPTVPGFSQPGMPGTTGRANWGLDPAGALGGAAGMALGVPFVGGFLADQLSAALGRPLEVSLGPDVFGGSTVDPVTGETVQTATHTGGSMTIQDGGGDRNTFVGAPPALGHFGGGVSNVAPGRQTFTGVDPAPVDQAPEAPEEPVAPNPTPIDEAPDGINVDPGNTQMSPSELTNLFLQYMPTRTSRGRNSARVVA